MNLVKLFELTCKKATFLVSKGQEGKLTLRERVLLLLHLRTCEPCRRFVNQSKIISRSLSRFGETSMDPDQNLSAEKKLMIQKKIEELMNRGE